MSDDANAGFKVKDKRRFDAEGKPREEGGEGKEGQGSKPEASKPSENEGKESIKNIDGSTVRDADEQQAYASIDFSSFVMSLATQALMQLGEMQGPEGMNIPIDKQAAKQTIDIIAMLEEKTKGNLEDQERRLLDEILHNLRISFVKAS